MAKAFKAQTQAPQRKASMQAALPKPSTLLSAGALSLALLINPVNVHNAHAELSIYEYAAGGEFGIG
jgi:hypothetical protein